MQVNDINRFLTAGLSFAKPVRRRDYPMITLSTTPGSRWLRGNHVLDFFPHSGIELADRQEVMVDRLNYDLDNLLIW